MGKIRTTKYKYLVAIKIGSQRELFGFPTKAKADSFAKAARAKGASVIRSKL